MKKTTAFPLMYSINEAVRIARQKVTVGEVALRKVNWAYPDDHIIVKYDGHGLLPWVTMRFPTSGPVIGVAPEQSVLIMSVDCDREEWVPYAAPTDAAPLPQQQR